jgi:hypothetical protein
MQNLISYNQLAGWKQYEDSSGSTDDFDSSVNDYFQCLIECDDSAQNCKRVCRSLLE